MTDDDVMADIFFAMQRTALGRYAKNLAAGDYAAAAEDVDDVHMLQSKLDTMPGRWEP